MAPFRTNREAIPAAPSPALGDCFPLIIKDGTSPEMAIKLAYDFARGLRGTGVGEPDFAEKLKTLVETPYADSPLLLYLRAGFTAGYFHEMLPWRRQIEAGTTQGSPRIHE
jgi:hypothetical protein